MKLMFVVTSNSSSSYSNSLSGSKNKKINVEKVAQENCVR